MVEDLVMYVIVWLYIMDDVPLSRVHRGYKFKVAGLIERMQSWAIDFNMCILCQVSLGTYASTCHLRWTNCLSRQDLSESVL